VYSSLLTQELDAEMSTALIYHIAVRRHADLGSTYLTLHINTANLLYDMHPVWVPGL